MPRAWTAIIITASVALVAAGCGGGDAGDVAGTDTGRTQQAMQQDGGETSARTVPERGSLIEVGGEFLRFRGKRDVSGDQRTTVEQGSFFFEPTLLAGEAGQKLTVELQNPSRVPHTFTLAEQNVDVVVQPGESATAEVTFPQQDPQVFVCRFHAQQGMRGALTLGDVIGEAAGEQPSDGGRTTGQSGGDGGTEGTDQGAGAGY